MSAPQNWETAVYAACIVLQSSGMTLTIPAKLHPEVIVQAVAARDRKRAEQFAKKHGIPEIKDSHQAILDDPNIDCVLVPLPNAVHFEWAVRAIRAGKHVLLEKPSVSNPTEAGILFNLPKLDQPKAPVMLEAFHYRFHRIGSLFRSLVNPADVFVNKDHIHFNSTNLKLLKPKFRFPNGGIGEAFSTLQGPTIWHPSYATVTHKQVVVPDKTLPTSQEKLIIREVTLHGFIHAIFWHRIDIRDACEIRSKEDCGVIKRWKESRSQKAYTPQDAGGELACLNVEDYWMSVRY